jgi:hypothetical protein
MISPDASTWPLIAADSVSIDAPASAGSVVSSANTWK